MPSPSEILLPSRYSPGFTRFFGKYVSRLFRSRFHAVRIAKPTARVLAELDPATAPVIVAMNHVGWWDPLLGLFLARTFLPSRVNVAPMEIEQLKKFGFFRRLGIFGIAPEAPGAPRAMLDHVRERFQEHPRPTLWISPQGTFADVRAPIELRPGTASIAARFSGARVVVVAVEYAFWIDQKPEVFLRAATCVPDEFAPNSQPHSQPNSQPTTTAWHRALTASMRDNAADLARLVMARDPASFDLLCGGSARINPAMDLWLRARGKSTRLQASRDVSHQATRGAKPVSPQETNA